MEKQLSPIAEAIKNTERRIDNLNKMGMCKYDSPLINELKAQIEMLESILPKEKKDIINSRANAPDIFDEPEDLEEWFNRTFKQK